MEKSRFVYTFFVMALALVMAGCGSKQEKIIRDLEKMVEKVEASKDKLSQEEWGKYDDQFEAFGEQLKPYSSKLTKEQSEKIQNLAYRYMIARMAGIGSAAEQSLEKAQNALEDAANALDSAAETVSGDVNAMLDRLDSESDDEEVSGD